MTDTRLKHKKIAVREADDIKFIPYTRHIDDTLSPSAGTLNAMM